jgi:hypothetical protein
VEPRFPNRDLHGESFLGFVAVAAAIWKSRFLSCDLRGESFSGFVAVAAAIWKLYNDNYTYPLTTIKTTH